ncbi:MAG: alkaline phosphatase PhoX [Panacagrimonas sp.]
MKILLPSRGVTRREMLRSLFWSAGAIGSGSLLSACGGGSGAGSGIASVASRFATIGPLGAADANGIRLPAGFSSRVVAVAGEAPAPGGATRWHIFPDGSAVFPRAEGGWIYVSNSEVPGVGALTFLFPELSAIPGVNDLVGVAGQLVPGLGGATALVFDAQAQVVDAYSILSGTTFNCAGGATPWNTWLSCEEFNDGRVWECDPYGITPAQAKPALGIFAHEALAVDASERTVYMTEDLPDGRFYRFVATPEDWPSGARGRFENGTLQVMQVLGDPNTAENNPLTVQWLDAANPAQRQVDNRLLNSTPFDGGEGIWLHQGIAYFATKGDNRIWAYDTQAQTLEILYDFATASGADRILSGVDNLTVTAKGEILVAEDGGDMQLCVILPDRRVVPLLQIDGQDASEISGPAFSPDGRRLYFNSNRGSRRGLGLGITYEVLLPFAV